MKIYDDGKVAVYLREITPSELQTLGRRAAEKTAVSALLVEAFPDKPEIAVGHHPCGAPYLLDNQKGEIGKPKNLEQIPVSITHCSCAAALAIGKPGLRIGIDCETANRHRQLERVKQRILSPAQLPSWQSFPEILQAWGIKEALYKAVSRPGFALDAIPLPASLPGDVIIDSTTYRVLSLPTLIPHLSTILVAQTD